MKLGLDTVASLGSKGNDKAAVLAALFATNRNSVLGAYEFDRNGDTTLSDFGVYTSSTAGRRSPARSNSDASPVPGY